MMMKQEDLEKINRFIDGQAEDHEKVWVESLFLTGEENNALRNSLEKDWLKIINENVTSKVDLSHLLDRVHHVIRRNDTLKQRRPLRKFIRIYTRAAAILLLPLIIAGGIFAVLGGGNEIKPDKQAIYTVNAPRGSRVSFSLPDGTSGMLNSGSLMTYALPFSENRKITLNGEAWFEVQKDDNHPFEVMVGNSVIQVLGTTFNVNAYSDEKYIEVILVEGKIQYQNNDSKEIFLMSPDERLVSNNGKVSKSLSDPSKYISWTQGRLSFRNDPMAEVARRIERWYNVDVEITDRVIEDYSFRGTFEDDSLDEVLRLLSLTSPIGYRIISKKQLEDGTYTKEKIIVYLK